MSILRLIKVDKKLIEYSEQAEARNKSVNIVRRIRHTFQENLNAAYWLDDETKNYAKRKAAGMIENIGYPDVIFNSSYIDNEYADVNMLEGRTVDNILEAKRYYLVLSPKLLGWTTTSVIFIRNYSKFEQNKSTCLARLRITRTTMFLERQKFICEGWGRLFRLKSC